MVGKADAFGGRQPTTNFTILEALKQAIDRQRRRCSFVLKGAKTMFAEYTMWWLIALGCVPWLVSRNESPRRGKRRALVTWQVRALFWSLTVKRPVGGGRPVWRLTIPLIHKLSKAVWAALRKLVG